MRANGTVERRRDRLRNGLRVVTLEVPHLHSALVAVYVRCGSRHETPAHNGVSHFLEHMFFRGSDRFPDSAAMNARVETAGGDLNGITMRDQGFYYTPIHPRRLEVAFEVLGDLLCRPRLTGIEVEREVILEEMKDEVDARGRDVDIGNLSKRLVFGRHPLALKIAGTPRTVRDVSRRALQAHHRRFYVGANMVVACAGPVRRDKVLSLATEAFGRLPRGERASEDPPAFASGPRFLFVPDEEAQTEVMLSFPCPPEGHPDYPALEMARGLLDDGLSSRLPLNIVERRGLAYSVHASLELFCDCSLFEIDAACSPGKVGKMVEESVAQLARLAREPVPAAELERAKARHRVGLDFALDDLNVLAGWYGGVELFREPETFAQRVRALERVTAEQIREVAARTFRREALHLTVVGSPSRRAEERLARMAREADLPG